MKTKTIKDMMAPAILKKLTPALAKRQITIITVKAGDGQTDMTAILGGAMDGIFLQIGDGYASFNYVDKRSKDMGEWAFWFVDIDAAPSLDAAIKDILKVAKENS